MKEQHDNPLLSVDVIAVRLSEDGPEVAVSERVFEPHLGELALPGVLMRAGERVTDAARRAVTSKLGLTEADIREILVGQVFDTPGRDERGPTVSISSIALIDPAATGRARWLSYPDVPALPFDHNEILKATWRRLYSLIWQNPAVLRGLVGDDFITAQMTALDTSFGGQVRNPANVRRDLDALSYIERSAESVSVGRGRPTTRWIIQRAH